mgnify:CR=1 FL=1
MKVIIGKEYKRKELHNYFGGQRQGGISTPRDHPMIFVFTNKRGKDFGYLDGWNDSGDFLYTGEGQKGDMKFQSGNKALRDHVTDGKRVFLFEDTIKTFVRCIAEINFVDYSFIQTPDQSGINRNGIQFVFEKIVSNNRDQNQKINYFNNSYKKPNKTERRGLVTSRVGQGFYRQQLLRKFISKCAVTGNDVEEILIASHIVPWRLSSDEERLDPDNGILLSPLYDALFDKHMITFSDDGIMEVSSQFEKRFTNTNLDKTLKIEVNQGMKKYLRRHREQFRK